MMSLAEREPDIENEARDEEGSECCYHAMIRYRHQNKFSRHQIIIPIFRMFSQSPL